jgi:hypothetical protein
MGKSMGKSWKKTRGLNGDVFGWENHRTIAGGFSSNPAAKQGCKSNHSMMDIMGYKTNKHIDTYMSLSNHRRPKLPLVI